MILLAHGGLEAALKLMLGGWCMLAALFVLPGYFAEKRSEGALVSMFVGLLMSVWGFGSAISFWTDDFALDGLSVGVGVIAALVFVGGVCGVWRWFRLPRR